MIVEPLSARPADGRPAGLSTAVLADLLELLTRMLHARGYQQDLFPAQWVALRYFAKARPDKCTASDLARFQGMANGPVSRSVRTLLQKGLLEKSQDQPKGRAERLELADPGRRMLAHDPLHEIELALEDLKPTDQASLAVALEIMIRRISMK